MSSQGKTYMEKAISTVGAMLVLIATIQSATLAASLLSTTESPALSQATLTTQLINGTVEEPRILRLHKPCSDEHADFCENDGQCMYPQDTSTPSCICKAEYSGVRCMFFVDGSQSPASYEEVIGVCVGVTFLILAVMVAIYCCLRRRGKKTEKKGPLIKSHGSENSV